VLETWPETGLPQVSNFEHLPAQCEWSFSSWLTINPSGNWLTLHDKDDPWLNTLSNRGTGFEHRAVARKGQFVAHDLRPGTKKKTKTLRMAPVPAAYHMTPDSGNYWWASENYLVTDSATGRFYHSCQAESTIWVYDATGQPVHQFGERGAKIAQADPVRQHYSASRSHSYRIHATSGRYEEPYYDPANRLLFRVYSVGLPDPAPTLETAHERHPPKLIGCPAPLDRDTVWTQLIPRRPHWAQVYSPDGEYLREIPLPWPGTIVGSGLGYIWLARRTPTHQPRIQFQRLWIDSSQVR
jgi:hypothetical protein